MSAPLEREEPVAMLKAIKHIRVSLQKGKAGLFPDKTIKGQFRAIVEILRNANRMSKKSIRRYTSWRSRKMIVFMRRRTMIITVPFA